MKSALIIGGDSTIGKALHSALLSQGVSVSTTSRKPGNPYTLDLGSDPSRWPELPQADVTYLCAAVTKLEVCESNPDKTYFINVTRMQQLAEKLHGSHIVFLSSNQVFSGLRSYPKTTHAADPMNKYGKQKLAFEQWLQAQDISSSILRLTKVISAPLPILDQWKKQLRENEKVHAFDDLIFAPLDSSSMLKALMQLGKERISGIFHLSGIRDVSYYEIAKLLAEKMGIHERLIAPASARHKGILPQFLPKHGTLESSFPGIHVPNPEQIIF